MHFIYNLSKWGLYLFLAISMLIVGANVWVVNSTTKKVFFSYDTLPNYYNVALVLGTSPLLAGGLPNVLFNHRMEAAATLYKKGKVKHIIVSGDNRTKYYNEPAAMKKKLLMLGVPASAITLDYAGLRTLDSIVRGKEIFGQNKFMIVTQVFHSYRALFISEYYDIDAVALAADALAEDGYALAEDDYALVNWREYFARARAILDLYIFKTAPHHMGKQEILPYHTEKNTPS